MEHRVFHRAGLWSVHWLRALWWSGADRHADVSARTGYSQHDSGPLKPPGGMGPERTSCGPNTVLSDCLTPIDHTDSVSSLYSRPCHPGSGTDSLGPLKQIQHRISGRGKIKLSSLRLEPDLKKFHYNAEMVKAWFIQKLKWSPLNQCVFLSCKHKMLRMMFSLFFSI